MIFTLISIVLILVGIIYFILDYKFNFYSDIGAFASIISITCGTVCAIICIMAILIIQATASISIAKNNIKYDGLVKQVEILQSNYEDISNVEVINRVQEWNSDVAGYKYWVENPWTNWFYSKRVADNLEYIEIDIEEK